MRKRIGAIEIADSVINHVDYIQAKSLNAIFSKFIPLQARHDLVQRKTLYVGLCEDFDIVEVGESYPTYLVELTVDDEGTVTEIKFVKDGGGVHWHYLTS